MNKGGIRGGTRGGKDQFDWEEVKTDKDRENYLGHSLKASVGRWQKGRDLTWYTKESKVAGRKEKLRAELVDLKRAEEEAMAAALGLKPPAPVKPQQSLSKQELADVCRRRSTEEIEGMEERVKGIGYQSRRAQAMFVGTKSSTTKEGATIFEHGSEVKDDGKLKMSKPSHPSESDIVSPTTITATTTATTPSESAVYGPTVADVPSLSQVHPSYCSSDYTPKKKKKKKDRVDSDQSVSSARNRGDKKNKKRKKHHRKEEEWGEVSSLTRKEHKTSRKRKRSTSPRKRRRDSTSSDTDREMWVGSGAKKAKDDQRTSPHHKYHHKHHHSHHKADKNR